MSFFAEQSWNYYNTVLQIILQNYSNKNFMVQHKKRHTDQWEREEDTEIKSHDNSNLLFDKGAKKFTGKKIASSSMYYLHAKD
jgi:hypothetical protein